MSLYIKQIEQLIFLQQVDDEILTLEKRLNEAPQKINLIEQKLETQQKQKKDIKEKIEVLTEQEKKLNQEIEENYTKIKKGKNRLMMVENSKEYHAIMREMDNLEKTNRMREEEKVALEEDLATQNNIYSSLESEIERTEEELQEKKKNMEFQLSNADNRLKELREKREKSTQDIPKPILSRYEFIRSRLNNPVIVSVEKGICTGCNISIPPQIFIELQKGEQILSCPNCQRLIYWKNHFDEES